MSSPRVFLSYSHKDELWRAHLAQHLGVLVREGELEVWDDQRIRAGDDWEQEITNALSHADVAILLVSVDFLNSEFVRRKEIPQILSLRRQRGLRVIPLVVRPCPWKEVSWLASIQMRPQNATPLSGMTSHDAEMALSAIAEEVSFILAKKSNMQPATSEAIPTEVPRPRLVAEPKAPRKKKPCRTGIYEVDGGGIEVIPLDVERGDILIGFLAEAWEQRFSYRIVHSSEVPHLRDGQYDVEEFGDDEFIHEFRWRVPRRGPWYLVLEARYKQNTRQIGVQVDFESR